ncbi:MAG: LysR family transcriptional regulator [Clostridiales bacterium]|nr:LysR family transcriptional regulator [Clostridiales bacterium]
MTLRHLRIFVAVCEMGSMTAAASQLFIAQPSISLAVSEMEEYYGVKLFDRISRKLYLTENGRRALQYARHIINLLDEMEQGIKDLDTVGQLRVGTSITIGTYLLPHYIRQLKERYPSVKVEAFIGNSGYIEQQILDNEIDIGIIEGVAHSSYICSESFPGDRLAFICATDHIFAGKTLNELGEIKGQDFILREKGSAGREIFDGLTASQELAITPMWQSASNQAIIHGVKEGLGISILPYFLVQESLEKGEMAEFKIKGLTLNRKFSVIYHRNKFLPKSAMALMNLCKGNA